MLRNIIGAVCMVAMAIVAAPYLQAKLNTGDSTAAGRDTPTLLSSRVQDTPRQTTGRLRVRADRLGHFTMTAVVNGRRIEVMADTGASSVALSHEDARKLGIRTKKSDYTIQVRTANGVAYAAPVTLREVRIGSLRVRNVRALVTQPGTMNTNLLGMSFLGELSEFSIRGDELVMVQ